MIISFLHFKDKPYLDLASHVRLRTSSVNEDGDDSASERMSLTSVDSQQSLVSQSVRVDLHDEFTHSSNIFNSAAEWWSQIDWIW